MDGAARAWTARPTAWPPAGGPSRRRSTRRRVGGEGAVPFAPPPLPAVLMGKQQRSLPPSHAVTGASPARAREKVVILDCLSEPPATLAWRPPQRVTGACLRTSRVDAGAQSTGVARVSRRRQPPWRLGRCHRDRRDAAYVAIFINARATRSGCPELSKSRPSPWCAEGKPNRSHLLGSRAIPSGSTMKVLLWDARRPPRPFRSGSVCGRIPDRQAIAAVSEFGYRMHWVPMPMIFIMPSRHSRGPARRQPNGCPPPPLAHGTPPRGPPRGDRAATPPAPTRRVNSRPSPVPNEAPADPPPHPHRPSLLDRGSVGSGAAGARPWRAPAAALTPPLPPPRRDRDWGERRRLPGGGSQ